MLSIEHERSLVTKADVSSPLFIMAACDEMRAALNRVPYSQLLLEIRNLPHTLAAITDVTLTRLEAIHGAGLIGRVLSAIYLCHGLYEAEIVTLIDHMHHADHLTAKDNISEDPKRARSPTVDGGEGAEAVTHVMFDPASEASSDTLTGHGMEEPCRACIVTLIRFAGEFRGRGQHRPECRKFRGHLLAMSLQVTHTPPKRPPLDPESLFSLGDCFRDLMNLLTTRANLQAGLVGFLHKEIGEVVRQRYLYQKSQVDAVHHDVVAMLSAHLFTDRASKASNTSTMLLSSSFLS